MRPASLRAALSGLNRGPELLASPDVTTLTETLAAIRAAAGREDLSWAPPPASGWPLSQDALRFAMAAVRVLRPRHVVELGAGLSSRALARAAAGLAPACALSSVDHDPEFGAAAERDYRADPTPGVRARFQIAPVVVRDCGGDMLPVYAVRPGRLASRRPVDLALVDGPPEVLGGREGTLYQLMGLARPGTLVLLDDAARPQEQAAVARWQENLGDAIEAHQLEGFRKGMAAILIRRPVPQPELWDHRARLTALDLAAHIPAGARVLLLDDNQLGPALLPGRAVRPFTERDGAYNGPPEDDEAGLAALEAALAAGVDYVAIAWPSFWWLDHYPRLARRLREQASMVLGNNRVMVLKR